MSCTVRRETVKEQGAGVARIFLGFTIKRETVKVQGACVVRRQIEKVLGLYRKKGDCEGANVARRQIEKMLGLYSTLSVKWTSFYVL
jgi:hypothetical protein